MKCKDKKIGGETPNMYRKGGKVRGGESCTYPKLTTVDLSVYRKQKKGEHCANHEDDYRIPQVARREAARSDIGVKKGHNKHTMHPNRPR